MPRCAMPTSDGTSRGQEASESRLMVFPAQRSQCLPRSLGALWTRGSPGAHMTAPSCHGTNSSSPNPSSSLAVRRPEAVARTRSKICRPISATEYSPSRIAPQLTSMSSAMVRYISLLLASFRLGTGRQPKTDPRPVVKQTTLAPLATSPVTEHGSYPGLSMKTNPRSVTGSAYSYTAVNGEVPPLATAPSDFSKMVG